MSKVRLINADVLSALAMLPDESVQCVVTSPPYWSLRDYGVAGQIGLEPTIEEYVAKMVEVFREVRRVLRSDGILMLNLGDSYNGSGGAGGDYNPGGLKAGQPKFPGRKVSGLKPKDLCMIPARVALALQADGWWLRSDIIWAKPNPMPESCTDRPTTAHEHIFLLTKSAKYFYDAEAVREESKCEWNSAKGFNEKGQRNRQGAPNQTYGKDEVQSGRNLRSVWTIATAPFPQAHFATFPPTIPERCIKAGTSERGACPQCLAPWKRVVEKNTPKEYAGKELRWGNQEGNANRMPDKFNTESKTIGWTPTCECKWGEWGVPFEAIPCTVLDPFSGAGTTALVAAKLGRDAIGIELNPDYVEMSRKRIVGEMGMLAEICA